MPFSLARSAIVLPTSLALATLPPVRFSPFLPSDRAGGNQGHSAAIVDHLRVNVVHRTVHIQPRTLLRAFHPFAETLMDPAPVSSFEVFGIISSFTFASYSSLLHDQNNLKFKISNLKFISLRSCRPSSSGARPRSARPCSCTDRADAVLRISAATCPTFWRSMPFTRELGLLGIDGHIDPAGQRIFDRVRDSPG